MLSILNIISLNLLPSYSPSPTSWGGGLTVLKLLMLWASEAQEDGVCVTLRFPAVGLLISERIQHRCAERGP